MGAQLPGSPAAPLAVESFVAALAGREPTEASMIVSAEVATAAVRSEAEAVTELRDTVLLAVRRLCLPTIRCLVTSVADGRLYHLREGVVERLTDPIPDLLPQRRIVAGQRKVAGQGPTKIDATR